MKNASENLHFLIKSLTKSEKGYFLKFSAVNHQYIKLFKAIDSQHDYDEKELKTILKDESFIKQLHVAKNYLFKVLLKSLNNFNACLSVNHKLSEIVDASTNLYRKGLYNESLKYILKGKHLIYYYEKYDFLPELIRREKYILINHLPADISSALEKLSEEEYRVTEIFKNLYCYRNLYGRIYSLLRISGSARGRNEEVEFKKIITDPLLKNITHALSYEAKLLYYQIHLINAQGEANDNKILSLSKSMVKLMNSHPAGISEFEHEYVFAFIEKLSAAFNLGKYNEALRIINDLRNLKVKSFEQKEYIFLSSYIIQLKIYIVQCEFETASLLICELEKELKTINRKEIKITEIILYLNIFYVYFAVGQYDKALNWLNKIFAVKLEMRQDIFSLAHILNLLVHYELDNTELLSYEVINTYRYLKRKKKLYKFEEVVLRFIKQVYRTSNIIDEFRILKAEVLKLVEDPYERIPLGYFDFISWLDSKITGKPFIEVKKMNMEEE